MDLDNIKKPTKKNTNIVPFQNILYYLEVKTNKAKSDYLYQKINTHLLTLISIRFIVKGKKGRSTFEAHLFISNKGPSPPPPSINVPKYYL